MKGMVLANEGHFVNVIPPIDITDGVDGDRFTMANHQHATIYVQVGVSAAAFTKIIVRECDAVTAGTATDIPFIVYKEETAAGDTIGAKVAVLATGVTPSANDDIFYVIELDAQELTDGFPWIEIGLTNTTNAVLASCCAILTGKRYQGAEGATAIA